MNYAERAGAIIGLTATTLAIAAGIGESAVAGNNLENPLPTLTRVIDGLEHGKPAVVTDRAIKLPGPVAMAIGRPIIFAAQGHLYEAYTQGSRPNFRNSPDVVASQMAVVERSWRKPIGLTTAHLNGAKILVENKHDKPVGYSVGGGKLTK